MFYSLSSVVKRHTQMHKQKPYVLFSRHPLLDVCLDETMMRMEKLMNGEIIKEESVSRSSKKQWRNKRGIWSEWGLGKARMCSWNYISSSVTDVIFCCYKSSECAYTCFLKVGAKFQCTALLHCYFSRSETWYSALFVLVYHAAWWLSMINLINPFLHKWIVMVFPREGTDHNSKCVMGCTFKNRNSVLNRCVLQPYKMLEVCRGCGNKPNWHSTSCQLQFSVCGDEMRWSETQLFFKFSSQIF